jgi:GntR family transcriptional regulator
MIESIHTALKKQSRLPLSLKLKYVLRARLERGEWALGARIPTLLELVAEYGVSRATVRAALDELETEGLIQRTRGKGTFVTGDAAKEHWLMLPTDWRSLVRHIEHLKVRFVTLDSGVGILPPEVPEQSADQLYWWTLRINWTDHIPYSLNTVYVAKRLFDLKQAEFEAEPVLPAVNRYFRAELHSATQVLTIRAADALAAKHLHLEIGTAVAQALRVARNAAGEVVYVARVLYPAKYLSVETHFHPDGEPEAGADAY